MAPAQTPPAGDGGPVPAPSRQSRGFVLVKGVSFNLVSLVLSAVLSLILTPIMIRGLGQYYYGMWVLVMSLVDQYGLLDIGMGSTLARFTGYFAGSERRSALDETLSTSMAFAVWISIAICVATAAFTPLLPGWFAIGQSDRKTFTALVLLLGLTTAIGFPERMLSAYLRGLQRFDLFNIVGTSVLIARSVLVMAALLLGYGVLTVAAITALTGLASLVCHYGMVRRADPDLSLGLAHVRRARLRELFGFSVYVFIASIGSRLVSRINSIVIARVLGVAFVTPFSIGSRLMDYFMGVFGAVHGPVMSSMSELAGRSQHRELQWLFLRATKFTCLLSFFIGSLLLFDGRTLLTLWLGRSGVDITAAYYVLAILVPCYVALSSQLPSSIVIYARARHQILAWLVLGEGAANLGLSIYWAREYGLLGVALGTTVPALINQALIIPWYALRVANVPAGVFLRQSILRPAAAAAIFALGCHLTAAHSPRLLPFALAILGQTLAYAVISYLVGLSGQERDAVRRHVRRWLSSFRRPRPLPVGESCPRLEA